MYTTYIFRYRGSVKYLSIILAQCRYNVTGDGPALTQRGIMLGHCYFFVGLCFKLKIIQNLMRERGRKTFVCCFRSQNIGI